jgi:hydrogenase nickel incorporation protein HypA/HybF
MHEVGIANEILRASQTEAARWPGSQLVRVVVRVGVLAGVDPDALRFAWDVLSKVDGTAPELEIQTISRRNQCGACGNEFASDLYSAPCPVCASENSFVVCGEELQLASVEVEGP